MKIFFLLLFLTICAGLNTGVTMAMTSTEKGNGMLSVTIGTTEQFQHPEAFRMPYDFHWQSSISQTIYYPEEIEISRGIITGIDYYINFQQDLPGKEIQIWLGETSESNNYNQWVNPQDFTLVYDGLIDFPQGENTLHIVFDTPYEYNGQNLVIHSFRVWDTDYYGWGNRFYTTDTPGAYRTRQVNEDNNTLDPLEPEVNGNWRVGWFPAVTLNFPAEQMATLQGNVSANGQPLENVNVFIQSTTASVNSNSDGDYNFPPILADSYSIIFSKPGYLTHIEENVVLYGGQDHVIDVEMNIVEQYTLFGVVTAADNTPIAGATALLEGVETHQTETVANGEFVFENIDEGAYTLTLSKQGFYETIIAGIVIAGGDHDAGTIELSEIIVPPLALTAEANADEPGTASLSWYHGLQSQFRHDDDFVYWIGLDGGDENTFFGTAFRNYAVITELAWYLSSEIQSHPTVNLWLIGLDSSGQPDANQLLWQENDISNTDDQWNTLELDDAIVAPNGFLFGITAPNGVFLGTDSGDNPQWPFRPNTHFFSENPSQGGFSAIETISSIQYNFNLRAFGLDNGEIPVAMQLPVNRTPQQTNFLVGQNIAADSDPKKPIFGNRLEGGAPRAFSFFNVYLNDMDEPHAQTNELSYVFSGLEQGDYIAAVEAVYVSGVSTKATTTFVVEEGAPVSTGNIHAREMMVYPNPFSQTLHVHHPELNVSRIIMYDFLGVEVYRREYDEQKVHMETESLLPGVYLMKVILSDDTHIMHRVIKRGQQ